MREKLIKKLKSQGWLHNSFSDFSMLTFAQGSFHIGVSIGDDGGAALYAGDVQVGELADSAWFVELSATTPDEAITALITAAMKGKK